MRKCAGGTPCHHFGFALQNLSRGRRPIKSHSNVQKSASSFCTLAWLSAWLMPDAQKEKPSAHSSCAKGECLAVPPFLMLLSRISQRSFNGDRTGRLTVKVQPVGSKATFHTCFPTDSSQPVGNLSLAVPGYVLLFLTTFVLFRYSLYHSRGFFICQGGVSLTPPQKLSPALSLSLRYRPRSRLFPAWSPRRRG